MPNIEDQIYNPHSEEFQEIISAPPHWLVNWGMSIFFAIILVFVGLAGLIQSPDKIKSTLVITSSNSPKPIIAKFQGRLVKILVKENDVVKSGDPLGYMESTADHGIVIKLYKELKKIQASIISNQPFSQKFLLDFKISQLGELQANYQAFYMSYIGYKASVNHGIDLERVDFLRKDFLETERQRRSLVSRIDIKKREYEIAKLEYDMHEKLYQQKVEAFMELKREEAKLLAKRAMVEDLESALMTNRSLSLQKEKEILELDSRIVDEKLKFNQAVNTLTSDIERWMNKYILYAPQDGKVVLGKMIRLNQVYRENEELFYISQGNVNLFGEMEVRQENLGKVKVGQKVLIKLKSYPFEEYGILNGSINSISEVPFKDSIFISTVKLSPTTSKLSLEVVLKNGLAADAEIITQEASLLRRLLRNIIKIIN